MRPDERRRMQELVQELWRLEGPYVQTHVGDLAWGSTHPGGAPPWRARLWEDSGRVVACAWMRRPAELEYEIYPEHRPGSLQDEILAWFERESEGDALTTYSLSTNAERLAFLEERGYEPHPREKPLDYHVRALDEPTQIELPPGFRLRTVEPGDFERRVAVHRAAWEPSRVTEESYRDVMAAWPYRADLDCVVVAPDGSFAASCLAWLDEENGVGELEPVGTVPAFRRRGLASAVCRFALRRLHEAGATQAVVCSSTPEAKALYESIGFREHTRSLQLGKRS
jgi:ribosomal protein S18 acetylase RimI-like enzyme